MNRRNTMTVLGCASLVVAMVIAMVQMPALATSEAQATARPTATPRNQATAIVHLQSRVSVLETAVPAATSTPRPATATPLPITPSVTPSVTPRPATATPRPATPTPVTPTPAGPTPTAPVHGGVFDCDVPAEQRNYVCGDELAIAPPTLPNLAGQACPDYVHDRYIVVALQTPAGEWITRPAPAPVNIAPHEAVWRTWHPSTDLATGCYFTHEHGQDPAASLADASAPAFGLIGCLHGGVHCAEPHHGFKVFVANKGQVNDEGRRFLASSRMVFHFGTSGIGRFERRDHSAEMDYIGPNGEQQRTMLMLDTGLAGNICQRDPSLSDGVQGNEVTRVLQENPATTTCPKNGPYEIWFGQRRVYSSQWGDPNEGGAVAKVKSGFAAFNPATFYTLRDGEVSMTQTGEFGCDREAYHEGAFMYSRFGDATVYTDMMGQEIPPGTPGGALQRFSRQYGEMSLTDDGLNVMKWREDNCAPGLEFPN